MKAKKHISKKLLALLLSVLMVVTTVPLVAIPATAASATASPNFYSTITTGTRGESGRIAMTNDGQAQSTSIGILRFDISSWPASVVSAKMKFGVSRDSNYHTNASIGFYSATRNFDTVTSSPQASGRFNEILGSSFSSNSTTHINSAKSYFGLGSPFASIALSEMNAGSSSGGWNYGEKEIDVTSAVNAAKAANQSVLQIVIMHPQSYYSNPWSDVNISSSSVKITYSDTLASASENTTANRNALNSVSSAVNTAPSITTTHGRFRDDGNKNGGSVTETDWNNAYKNVLYSPTLSPSSKNMEQSSSKTVTVGGNKYFGWFYPETVMMYDGVTAPTTGVLFFVGGPDCTVRSSYIDDSSGLSLAGYWKGETTGRKGDGYVYLDHMWPWVTPSSGLSQRISYTKTTSTSNQWVKGNAEMNHANLITFSGTMSDTEFIRTVQPVFGVNVNGSYYTSSNGSETKTITIINYNVIRKIRIEAQSMIAQIRNTPAKYDPSWVASYINAANAVCAINPNNYITASSANVSGYETAARTAVAAYNNVKNPVLAKYGVTYKSHDGRILKTVETEYCESANFELAKNAPTENSAPTQNGASSHTIYSWNLGSNTYVTDNKSYSESGRTENHNLINCTSISDTQHTKTCSVCGYVETSNHGITRVEVADNNTQHQLSCSDCSYTAMEDHSYNTSEVTPADCIHNQVVTETCSQCNHVWQHEVANTATGVHVWETNGTPTKDPTWDQPGQTTYKCTTPGCTETVTREDIPALGDDDAPTGSVTFRGFVYDKAEHQTITKKGFEENPSFDLFPQAGSLLRTVFNDSVSGVASAEYFIADRAYALQDVKDKADGWTAVTNNSITLPVDTEGTFIVYVKVADNAGNIAYFSAPGYTVDKTNPVVTLPESKVENTYCVSVDVTVSDANLKNVTLDGAEVTLTDGKLAVTAPGEHTVVATDKGGNEATVTFTVNAKHQGGTANCVDKAVCELCGQEYGEVDANNHKSLSDEIAGKDATCTEDGYTAYRHCNACDQDVGKTTLDHTGHTPVWKTNNDGTHSQYCSVCQEVFVENEACSGDRTGTFRVAACEHPDQWEHKCAKCDYIYWEDVAGTYAKGHHYYDTATFNWTETADGWTCDAATFACINCDHTETATATVTDSVTTPATCEQTGIKTFTARATLNYTKYMSNGAPYPVQANASESKEFTLPALDHDWSNEVTFNWTVAEDGTVSATATRSCLRNGCTSVDEATEVEVSEGNVKQNATCKLPLITTYTATATFSNGDTATSEEYDVTGNTLDHDWGDVVFNWVEAEDGTYTATATRTCKNGCGETKDLEVNIETSTITATCTVPGSVTYTATVEGVAEPYTKKVDGTTDPNNHKLVDVPETNSTCTEKGHNAYQKCEYCDKEFGRVDKELLPHTCETFAPNGNGTHTSVCSVCNNIITEDCVYDTETVTDPTCTTDGYTTHTCKCGNSYIDTYVDALGHDWENGTVEITARPTQNQDGTWTKGEKTFTCHRDENHTKTEEVSRAKYTEYDEVVAKLQDVLKKDITDEAKTLIEDALNNTIDNNLVTDEQKTVDDEVARLKELEAQLKALEEEGKLYNTYTVKFVDEDGNVVEEVTDVAKGATVTATKAVPDKAPDAENHYTANAWAKAENVTENVTIKATYTAEAHKGGTATCTDKAVCEVCDKEYGEVDPNAHSYGEVIFNWADDFTCTATRVCTNDATHVDTAEEVNVTDTVTTPATCTEKGVRTYTATATFADGTTAEDTATAEIPALGHAWTPTFSWTADENGATCTAEFVCSNNGEHTATKTANATVKSRVEPNCENAGSIVYEASFQLDGKTYTAPDKTVELEMLEHTHTKWTHIDGTKTHKSVCDACGKDEKIADCTPGEWITDKEATYTEDGLKHTECTVCGATVETETIPALRHHWGEVKLVWAEDNTCKAVRSCTDDDCTETQEVNATVTSEVTTEATCTVAEVTTYTAKVTIDGTDYTDTKEVTGTTIPHTEVEIPAVPATCTTDGSTAGKKCSVCGEIIEAPQTEKALGHSFTNYVSNDNATCTADGTETAKCDRCDVKDTRTVVGSKLGHDWEERYTWSTDYKTCTATRVCKNDAKHNQGPKNATVTSVTTPATCETDGSIVYTAKVTFDKECTTTQTVTLKAFGHNYGDPTFNWNDDYSACEVVKVCKNNPAEHVIKAAATVTSVTIDATCEEAGKTVYTATAVIDGQTVTETKEVPIEKLAHTFGEWKVTKPATCKEAGTETRTCSACGETETREIAKLAHTEQVVPGYAATCGKTGLTDGIICSVCGTVIKAQEVIPATGKHTDNDGDGICDDCGTEINHEHVDADGDGKCDHCGQDVDVHHDNCICHKNNIFSKILRYICTLLTKICRKRVACCPDMEYYGGKIKDLT